MMNYFNSEKKQEFLQNVKSAREERALEKKKEESAIFLQSRIRGWLARRRYRTIIVNEFDEVLKDTGQPKPALLIFHIIKKLLSVWNEDADSQRFLNLCRYITKSLEEENSAYSFVGVFLVKEYSVLWISQIKEILQKCNIYLKNFFTRKDVVMTSTELQNATVILLHTMVSFTSINTWRIFHASNLKAETLQVLKPGLNQLCSNFIGFLVHHEFYSTLREILCRSLVPTFGSSKLTLTGTLLMAVMVLSCRPLVYSNFGNSITSKFIENILTIPALIHHAYSISPQFLMIFDEDQLLECLMGFMNQYIKERSIAELTAQLESKSINSSGSVERLLPDFTAIEKNNNLLCFTANFIELGHIYLQQLQRKQQIFNYINILIFLLTRCQERVSSSRSSNLTQWHPILGWFSHDTYDMSVHECLPLIKHQLSLLWTKAFVSALFEEPLTDILNPEKASLSSPSSSPSAGTSVTSATSSTNCEPRVNAIDLKTNSFKKKALNLLADVTMANVRWRSKDADINSELQLAIRRHKTVLVCACKLYLIMVNTFVQLRLDILTGLCYQCDVLYLFWKYLSQNSCIKSFYRYVSSSGGYKDNTVDENVQILLLFCECMIHYVTILDDVEMYEQQPVFHTNDFIQLTGFLNTFLYKGIINEIFRNENEDKFASSLFASTHTLLNILYLRNCRRPYTTSKSHWIIKDIKTSSLFNDMEKNGNKVSFLKSKIPHVISYSERVHMFKKALFEEKCNIRQQGPRHHEGNIGINFSLNSPQPARVIKVRRNHIVEDAFHYLHKLNAGELKRAFRVKFLNAEGLEEAGVDQAGIFKEFIVDLVGKLFDPSLNLFRKTSQGHVYPSPITNLSETNHLDLIEFAGKILAKAVYEGIVLDVRLASFFLSQILGQTQSSLYSYLDDLPSLDNELYRSLMYVKHYEGDVSDLALTFSIAEEVFGTICTRELVPGGKLINVTNSNKIIYIHMMAHYRMHTQIKQQTGAFATGFHSIFSKEALSLFSVPELQLLISGEDQPLNFAQLRQNTQYYGGFHDSHRVIVWLWDILNNDFNEQERALFLKFVTSNSKPPVLGFAFLNPPFSIRCVEVSEDEDSGDSVGSVIRGFFTIRKKGPEHRLPTSSTCFNLLKLPNYSRKNVLRDKLRYAITANSGFELS